MGPSVRPLQAPDQEPATADSAHPKSFQDSVHKEHRNEAAHLRHLLGEEVCLAQTSYPWTCPRCADAGLAPVCSGACVLVARTCRSGVLGACALAASADAFRFSVWASQLQAVQVEAETCSVAVKVLQMQ